MLVSKHLLKLLKLLEHSATDPDIKDSHGDRGKLTGEDLGRVFNSIRGRACLRHAITLITKQPILKWKTRLRFSPIRFRGPWLESSRCSGATTLSITTFSLTTLSIMTFSKVTLSIMAFSLTTLRIMTFSITTLSITFK
jgi:hypothetical protein